jgi:CheY-like chemotaxis protein
MFSSMYVPVETMRHAMSGLTAFTILISDDSAEMLTLYRVILEHKGGFQHVIYVPAAEEVITICRTQAIALVISDIAKPDIDGLEMLKRLRADPATRSIPFLFVTSHADAFSQHTALELGADGFITMPFSPGTLLDKVASLLKKTNNSTQQESGVSKNL